MNDDNRERRWAQRIRRVPKPDAGAVEPLWKPPTGRRRGRRPKARRIALAFMASIFAGRSDRLFIAASIDLLSGRKGCQRIRPDRRAWPGKPTSAWPLPHRAGYRADFPPAAGGGGTRCRARTLPTGLRTPIIQRVVHGLQARCRQAGAGRAGHSTDWLRSRGRRHPFVIAAIFRQRQSLPATCSRLTAVIRHG